MITWIFSIYSAQYFDVYVGKATDLIDYALGTEEEKVFWSSLA